MFPSQLDVCVAKRELLVSLKEFCVRDSVGMVTTISDCWERGVHRTPSQHPFASRARCTTFSELTELKLLSEHLGWVLGRENDKSFISAFQLLP